MSALECAEYNAEIDKQSENEHDLAYKAKAKTLREEPRKSCGNCDFSGDGHCWESGFAALLPDAVCDKWQEMLCVSLVKAAELAGKK